MPEEPPPPGLTPSNHQRTTGGNLQWKPPTVEHLATLLPQYEIGSLIGHGGMGAVYRGRQKSLDREVAIKILPPEAEGDEEAKFVERFKNEARTMAKMNHPAIVHVYDFGETTEGQLYIVMEFIDGTDVSKMIVEQGRLPPEHALAITAHVCDALQYAHTHGVIHRDIKPANILINMEGAVKVADFGLAKESDPGQSGITRTNIAMGTPDFVAPEALIAGIPLDGRADLYAIGVMLYQMLTGNIPRGMFTMPSVMVKTDPRFDSIVARAMQTDREQRYQSAAEIRRDLDVILTVPMEKEQPRPAGAPEAGQRPAPGVSQGHAPGKGAAAAAKPESQVPDPKSKSNLGPIIGIGATFVIGIGLFVVFSGGNPKDDTAAAPSALPGTSAGSAGPDTNPVALATTPAPPPPSVPASEPSSVTRTLPRGTLTFGGHRYQAVSDTSTWADAKKKAEALGGHLVVIASREENDWIRSTFIEQLEDGRMLWIGATNSGPDGKWTWVTGEEIGFSGWVPEPLLAQPNLGSGFIGNMSNGAATGVTGWAPWQADAFVGLIKERNRGFLVEWDDAAPAPVVAMPNPPVPPLSAPATTPTSLGAVAASGSVSAAPIPASAASTAPNSGLRSPDSSDPRLVQLEAGFKGRYEADAQLPSLTAVAALNLSYMANGIARARAAAQARGSLPEVTALDAEKAAIERGAGVPAEDAADTPASLKDLRGKYRVALAKIASERDAKAAPLYDLYLKALDVYVAELTQANKIVDARKVQTLRDDIAREKPQVAAAPSKAASAQPVAERPASTSILRKPTGGSSWRIAADYLVSNGGSFVAIKNDVSVTVTKPAEIPSGRFDITELTIDRLSSVLPLPKDAEFQAFNGLRDLRRAWFRTAGLTDAAFAFLAGNDELTHLNFEGVTGLTDSLLTHIAGLRKLDTLAIQYAENLTGRGLDKIAGAASITNLEFLGSGITDEGMKAIGALKKLQTLRVSSAKITPAGFAALANLKTLVALTLSGSSIDDEAAGFIAAIPNLASLDVSNTKVTDAGLARLRSLKKLTSLNVSSTGVTAEAAAEIQKAMPQCRVSR